MVTTRNQANAPIAPCMFWRRIHRGCIMVTINEYLAREYGSAQALYKDLSTIRTLSDQRKKEVLKLVDAQLDIIETVDDVTGTAEEKRRLAFVNRVLIAARRLCLK